MRIRRLLILLSAGLLLFTSCSTIPKYKQADEYKHRIKSLALLPLLIGDDNGRVEKIGKSELPEFVKYFNSRFFTDFENRIKLINNIELKLPGRDFNINVYNGMDYSQVAHELGVDAVLGINLTVYNEIKPEAKGAQVALAVVTAVLLGGWVKENQIARYEINFEYLDIERVKVTVSFRPTGLPTIEEQRKFFVDNLIEYLDKNFPLSTEYVKAYKEE